MGDKKCESREIYDDIETHKKIKLIRYMTYAIWGFDIESLSSFLWYCKNSKGIISIPQLTEASEECKKLVSNMDDQKKDKNANGSDIIKTIFKEESVQGLESYLKNECAFRNKLLLPLKTMTNLQILRLLMKTIKNLFKDLN